MLMRQLEIQYFWPLTEQMELDLDYAPTHLHYRAQGVAGVHSMPIAGSVYEFTTVPTTIGLHVDLDQLPITVTGKPSWFRKTIFKLLGLQWKDRC